jgi:anti-sigma B factor antagonist
MTSTASRDFFPGPEMRPASRPPCEARVQGLGSSRIRRDIPRPRPQEVTQMLDGGCAAEVTRVVPAVAAPEELDITNADRLRSALLQAAADAHGTLVVDMTRTRFCDCAGLCVLMAAHKQARAEGRELLLVISSAAVLRLFALTGVDRVIPCFVRLDEAPQARARWQAAAVILGGTAGAGGETTVRSDLKGSFLPNDRRFPAPGYGLSPAGRESPASRWRICGEQAVQVVVDDRFGLLG